MASTKILGNMSKKIVIIGAGIAGIGAASSLLEKGFTDVTILEARDRIGGRIYSTLLGQSIIELGAQWIHGEKGNPVYKIAKENLLLHDEDEEENELDATFQSQDGELISGTLINDFEKIMDSFSKDCCDTFSREATSNEEGSVLWYFRRRFKEYAETLPEDPHLDILNKALFKWYCLLQCNIDGCDSLAELSAKLYDTYEECEGEQEIDLKNGYQEVLQVLLADLKEDTIISNKPVRAIRVAELVDGKLLEDNFPVTVLCLDGQEIQCHHAIVTCSLGYLKQHCDTMFIPPLPEAKRSAIRKIGFGTVNKIYLEFEKPFWPADSGGYSFLWLDDDGRMPIKQEVGDVWEKAILGFYNVINQPNVLCGWLAGEEARHLETLEDSEVVETSLNLLKRFTKNETLPQVLRIVRSNWHSDPYTSGSYSYLTMECDEVADAIGDLATPIMLKSEDHSGELHNHPAILFAGEATHPHYYSTVHGALLSGWREADTLINYYRGAPQILELQASFTEGGT